MSPIRLTNNAVIGWCKHWDHLFHSLLLSLYYRTNVPLSATESIVKDGETVLDYIPPHPQKGTKYHRYTLIAYEQPNSGKDKVDIKVDSRDGFDVKGLVERHGLQARGVSFFRQVWDETVSQIYSDILSKWMDDAKTSSWLISLLDTSEPIYGKPPRTDRYIRRAVYY